jgi:hypothetical protein
MVPYTSASPSSGITDKAPSTCPCLAISKQLYTSSKHIQAYPSISNTLTSSQQYSSLTILGLHHMLWAHNSKMLLAQQSSPCSYYHPLTKANSNKLWVLFLLACQQNNCDSTVLIWPSIPWVPSKTKERNNQWNKSHIFFYMVSLPLLMQLFFFPQRSHDLSHMQCGVVVGSWAQCP